MFGHGSPTSLALALARTTLMLCAVLSSVALGQVSSPPAPPFSSSSTPTEAAPSPAITPLPAPVRLQISWGGGEARKWTGQIRLDNGSLADLKLLSLDADAAGSMWLEGGQLRIGTLSAHKSDRVEITAEATSSAQLSIEIVDGPKSTPAKAQVSLAEVLRHPYQLRLDDRGNTLDIALKPSPTLQISFKRDPQFRESLIFAAGQQLSFELTLDLPAALHGTTLDLQTTLLPARRKDAKDAVWTDNQKISVPGSGKPTVDLTVPLQQPDGAYTVRVVVSRPSGYFRDKFFVGGSAALAERSFDIVVLDPRPQTPSTAARWAPVLEIDPTNPRWVERLPIWTQVRRIPGLNHGPLGSIRAGYADLPLGRFVELPPTVAGAEPHWQAYTLPLEAVGVPHMLEVDYPVDEEQHFGLSIVEPNAAGVVEGMQHDCGVYVEGFGHKGLKEKQTQRLIFWPHTQTPLLVVTNRHATAPAHFGPIRVLTRPEPLSAGIATPARHDRLVAAYLARPPVAATLGATQASEVFDPSAAPRGVDDSQTFYQTATRLSDYLRYAGYNSAVVSVMADGSSIFPASQALFTPRYDTGRLTDRLQEADALELALSLFDRDQLTLIPAIEFAAPLPQLEKLRREGDPGATGLELIGPDGRTWFETNGSRGGLAAYYNVLDPRVQQAMLDTVRDIVRRYGNHAAFGGLALQLTGDGYAQLPPLEWGLDDATIGRFEQATGISIPATGPERFATRNEVLRSQYADAWRKWRAAEVAKFYARLTEVVRGNTNRRLLITTEKLFDHPLNQQRIQPSLLTEHRAASTLVDLGIDRSALERVPGLVLCPSLYVEPTMPLPDRAVDLELNAAFARWRQQGQAASSGPPSPAVLYHRPQTAQLASFAARCAGTLKVANDVGFQCEPLPFGPLVRQPYLQALAANDPAVLVDGGEFLPLAQDDLLRNVRTVIANLPAAAEVTEIAKQPVLVRTYSEANQVTIVAMNISPWATTAQVTLDVPRDATLEPLIPASDKADAARAKSLSLVAGQQPWTVTLEPYDLQAVRIAVPGAKVAGVRAELNEVGQAELKTYVTDLNNRDLSAKHVYRGLANPGFEPIGGLLPGWRLAAGNQGAIAQLDATAPQEGKACLYFRNAAQSATVESDEFPIPATGQLAMLVYARGKDMAPGTDLRLKLECERNGQVYRRTATVAGNQTVQAINQWGQPFAIIVNDLPCDSQAKMRVAFELTGSGEVWLDNVTLYDLLCPLPFYVNAQAEILQLFKMTHASQSTFGDGHYADCLQLLDGYWPKFVVAYTPPVAPKVALAVPAAGPPAQPNATAPPPSPPPVNDGQQSPPGFSDRIKRFVPILH